MGRRGNVPAGVEVRGKSLRLTFAYRGVRCRETVKLLPTPQNIKFVERWRVTILHEIAVGTFDYAKHFPNSPRVRSFRPAASISVAEALKSWLKAQKKFTAPSTWEDYENTVHNHLVPKFGDYKLHELTGTKIKEWIGELECSAKRVNNLLIPLRGAFSDAYEEDVISVNPMARVTNLTISTPDPDPFSLAEVRAILDAAVPGQHGAICSSSLLVPECVLANISASGGLMWTGTKATV